MEKLEAIRAAFIDVGMGLEFDEGSLGGTLRVTASKPEKRDHSVSSAALTTSMRPTEPRRSNGVPRWNRRGTQIERPPRPPEHRLMQLVAAIHSSPRSSRYTSSPTISKRCCQVARPHLGRGYLGRVFRLAPLSQYPLRIFRGICISQ